MAAAFASASTVTAATEPSPLCKDLATFACSPGGHNDGTGATKSEKELAKQTNDYAAKTTEKLNAKFGQVVDDPKNEYFKNLALAGLGLKNSPQCNSEDAADVAGCRENLIDGLTMWAHRASGSSAGASPLGKIGNIEGMSTVLQNSGFQKVWKDMNAEAEKDLGMEKDAQKIKDKVFPQIKDLIVARLEKMEIPDKQKKFMISKVNAIEFEGTNCNEGPNGATVASLYTPNAFYNPKSNTFKYCSGYLMQSNSEFSMAAVIAHELGHSIDPCNIAEGPKDFGFKYSSDDISKMEKEYPIKGLISCLRDKRSAGARNFMVAPLIKSMAPYGSMGKDRSGEDEEELLKFTPSHRGNHRHGGEGGMARSAGGSGGGERPKANFCKDDQIGESFSDWLSAEVTPDYIASNHKLSAKQMQLGYSNTRRGVCRQTPDDESNTDEHPSDTIRYNKIMLANPKVREQMGCPKDNPDARYCKGDGSDGAGADSDSEVREEKGVPMIQDPPRFMEFESEGVH